jgi:hypothetical protein
MTALRILVSILLLLLGRQLFWLFVGGTGFVLTMELVTRLTLAWPAWLTLFVAIVAGIIGALLAILFQEIAVGVAGFVTGGYVVFNFLDLIGLQIPVLTWILVIIGAIVGIVLAISLFDWALILLSSSSGATLLVRSLNVEPPLTYIIFGGALILGIIIQASMMRSRKLYREQESQASS